MAPPWFLNFHLKPKILNISLFPESANFSHLKLNFSGLRGKFENRYGGAIHIHPMYSQPKNKLNSSNGLGCRGGGGQQQNDEMGNKAPTPAKSPRNEGGCWFLGRGSRDVEAIVWTVDGAAELDVEKREVGFSETARKACRMMPVCCRNKEKVVNIILSSLRCLRVSHHFPSPFTFHHLSLSITLTFTYRSDRNTRWKASKSGAPPLQPKPLGRIGSFFGERALMWLLSDAPRRFLNFVLKVEIWAHL